MINITYINRQRSVHKDIFNLYYKLTLRSKVAEFMPPIRVDDKWQSEPMIQECLRKVYSDIQKVYRDLTTRDIVPTAHLVKEEYMVQRMKPITIMNVYDEYVAKEITPRVKTGELSASYEKKFRCTRNHLVEFLETNRRTADIAIDMVDKAFVSELERDMLTWVQYNVVMSHMRRVKQVLTYAFRVKECISLNPFNVYDISSRKPEVVFLTPEELLRILETKVSEKSSVVS